MENLDLDEDKSNLGHATLRGKPDNTGGCIPQGYVYLPGFKNRPPPRKVFITRSPCTEGSDGMLLLVVCCEGDLLHSSEHTPSSALKALSKLSFGSVVFPLGIPSLPSRINKSDLDGDRFMVMWNDTIIEQIQGCSKSNEDYKVERVDNDLTAEWRKNQDSWFRIVQDALVENRLAAVSVLVRRCTRLYKEACRNHGINSPQAIIWGRAWKEANELEKHAGRVGLPLAYYNIITGKEKFGGKRTKTDKFIEKLVMVNGDYGEYEVKGYEEKKPFFKVGTKVSAPWSKHKDDIRNRLWYDGVVVDFEEDWVGDYGPVRKYIVKFDDDGSVRDCGDEFVFLREDQCLSQRKWHGIKNRIDKTSRDEWARIVGWYVAIIGK